MTQTLVPHDQEARLPSVRRCLKKAGLCPVTGAVPLSPAHGRTSEMTCSARLQSLVQRKKREPSMGKKETIPGRVSL